MLFSQIFDITNASFMLKRLRGYIPGASLLHHHRTLKKWFHLSCPENGVKNAFPFPLSRVRAVSDSRCRRSSSSRSFHACPPVPSTWLWSIFQANSSASSSWLGAGLFIHNIGAWLNVEHATVHRLRETCRL